MVASQQQNNGDIYTLIIRLLPSLLVPRVPPGFDGWSAVERAVTFKDPYWTIRRAASVQIIALFRCGGEHAGLLAPDCDGLMGSTLERVPPEGQRVGNNVISHEFEVCIHLCCVKTWDGELASSTEAGWNGHVRH